MKLVQCFIEQKKYQMAIEFILKTEIDNLNILSLSWYENSIQLTEVCLAPPPPPLFWFKCYFIFSKDNFSWNMSTKCTFSLFNAFKKENIFANRTEGDWYDSGID